MVFANIGPSNLGVLINHLFVFYGFFAFLYTHCHGVGGLACVFERILGNEKRARGAYLFR